MKYSIYLGDFCSCLVRYVGGALVYVKTKWDPEKRRLRNDAKALEPESVKQSLI